MADIESTTLGSANPLRTIKKLLGFTDNGSGGYVAALFDAPALGKIGITNVNSSRALLPADCNGGVLVSASLGSTIITLPTFYRLGLFVSNSENPVLAFRRGVLAGPLFVTPALCRGVTIANQAAMLALPTVTAEDYIYRLDTGTWWILTTGSPSVLGNWIEVPAGAANKPVAPVNGDTGVMVNWGADSTFDPQYREAGTTIQIEGVSLDHWIAG